MNQIKFIKKYLLSTLFFVFLLTLNTFAETNFNQQFGNENCIDLGEPQISVGDEKYQSCKESNMTSCVSEKTIGEDSGYKKLEKLSKTITSGQLDNFVTYLSQPISGENLIYKMKDCFPTNNNGKIEWSCNSSLVCKCKGQKGNPYADDPKDKFNRTCQLVQFIIADSGQNLAKIYMSMIYKWVASIIGVIAVIYIIINGIIISTAQNDSGQVATAKENITQSLTALVLLMVVSILLYAINPNFFSANTETQDTEQT